ncbi:MAG: outer membrane protein assembly factor BamD [Burkholderiaceae bacterium]|nr:outer membrane protein assembly factor BamD [Rhodoferax sp.]MCP5287431.1 outer membrane protein assembly factor BamD [Burkholderiaceae bacterium]
MSPRFFLRLRIIGAGVVCAMFLAGCGNAPKRADEQTAEDAYAEARNDLENGAYDAAIRNLSRVEALGGGTLISQQALLDKAYAQWKSGEREAAVTTLDRFVKFHPSSPAYDYALYLRGLVNFNDDLGLLGRISRQDLSERDQQASRDSFQSFKLLTEQFPDSKYTPDARIRMAYIVNALAAHEVHVARYYYRRGAFLAAANRAQRAVSDFQNAPAAEEALYIMARSYDRLGLDELRDGADRVLKLNFPDSRFLRDGLLAPDRAWWQFW